MINRVRLSPSLMCGDLFNLQRDLMVLEAHEVDYVHLDVSDGRFVPNIILGLDVVNRVGEVVSIPKDIHLMVERPSAVVQQLRLSPDDLVTFHIEAQDDPHDTIKRIRGQSARVGVAINPETPASSILPLLPLLDLVLIMSVQPGFAGQRFDARSYAKADEVVRAARSLGLTMSVGVDGAIGFEQIGRFHALGVGHFVLGTSTLFKPGALDHHAGVVRDFVINLPERSLR